MPLDRDRFFAGVGRLFGGHRDTTQQAGLTAILDDWQTRTPDGDLRWLAYMLATAFHETARTMQPVREAFWLSEQWRKTHLRYYPYYGRGYVQLTWSENYAKAGRSIGVNLEASPDLALQPANAASVMFFGMTEGWFRRDRQNRSYMLSRFFDHATDDPVGAREIVNGSEWVKVNDRTELLAEVIAKYHAVFLSALTAEPAAAGPGALAMASSAAPLAAAVAAAAIPAGWVLHVKRLRQERRAGEGFDRTVGAYTVFHDRTQTAIVGNTVERQGPGNNGLAGKASHTCIKSGTYPLTMHASAKYATRHFEVDGRHPRPALAVGDTDQRVGILIHPADGYGSTIGCINLAGHLVDADSNIVLPDSIARVMAVIADLGNFGPGGLPAGSDVVIPSAHLLIEDF